MMRMLICMSLCLIVFGCQSGMKIVKPISGESIPPLNEAPQQAIVVSEANWLPAGAYVLLLAVVGWLAWREFRGSTTKSD